MPKLGLERKKYFFMVRFLIYIIETYIFHGNHVFSKENGVIIRIERRMCCLQSMGGGNIKEINGDILTN